MPIALFPLGFGKYYYYDPDTGKKTKVGKKQTLLFKDEAVAFYEPLPLKPLGIPDLLSFMKRRLTIFDYLSVAILSLALVLVTMILPYASQMLTGTVLDTKDYGLFWALIVTIIVTIFFTSAFDALNNAVIAKIKWKVTIPVEQAVMQRILTLPAPFFRKFSAGELSSRSNSVNEICEIIIEDLFSLGFSSLFSLVYMVQIFRFAPKLVVPSLVIMLLTVLFSTLSVLMQVGISKRRMELLAKESGLTFAIINGIQKIKLTGSEKRVFARWGKLYSQGAKLDYNPPMFLKINPVISKAVTLFGTVVIYYLSVRTNVGVSNYIAFSAAYGNVTGAFQALAGIAISVAAIKPVLEMAEPILKAEPEVAEDKQAIDHVTGHIEMSHVTFRYDENLPCILTDMNLDIKAGEYVAIVGRTGCGKSTLVRLLLGFEKPEYGAIFYDNHELASVDPRTLRKHIGVVIQNGQLFQGDIFSNISISAPQLTMDEAWEVAEIAGIAQNIREMPMGMHTVISEGQGGISGGQKQRLMIARAIAPKPKILIFDEATSALDNKTQKQVSDALDQLKCTRIVIAHRLSTIRNCDRILVMDEGKIVEEGTYEDLIAQNGYFAELVARQRADLE